MSLIVQSRMPLSLQGMSTHRDEEGIGRLTFTRGKVFVFTGILPLCRDEDGIAAVLGHEIAHVVAHHTAYVFAPPLFTRLT